MFRWCERGLWLVLLFLAFLLGWYSGMKKATNNLDFWARIIKQKCAVEMNTRVSKHVRSEIEMATQLLACQTHRLGLVKGKRVTSTAGVIGGMGGD